MAEITGKNQDWDRLLALGTLQEYRFHSSLPVVGPLVAWARTLWNDVSTKWYVRPLIAQQNEFNAAMVDQLRDIQASIREIYARMEEMDGRSIQLDHDLVQVRKDLAITSLRLASFRQGLPATGQEPAEQERR